MSDSFNPYAAPESLPPGAIGPPAVWEPGEAFALAWERFKKSWVVLVFAYVIEFVVIQATTRGPVLAFQLVAATRDRADIALAQTASTLAAFGVSAFFMVGLLRLWLDAARGRTPNLGTLFLGGDRFLPMLGLYFLMFVTIVGGLLLFIVPGIIASLGLSFAPFYLVDANLGPVEAMRASWAATKGQRGKVLGFTLLSVGVFLLGLLACVIGVIPATSLAYVAWAVVYSRISGREPAIDDPAGLR